MARSAQSAGFSPAARPHVSVAADGTLVAIQEPTRIAIAELPSCSAFAELGLDAAAQAVESAWVGTPPRLLVLARHSGHSTVHLVDPFGPRTIAEIRLEAPMKLCASVGSHALVIGSLGAAILSASDKGVALHQFPARARPVTAGAAGTMFVVALAGAIEEWDPANRMPKRRLKLPRPAVIKHVGGSDRVIWMITNDNAAHIEVIPLVNRGQPKVQELPEPIASIASHPRSDLVVCVGAKSGRIFVVDLDGRAGLRMIGPEGIDRAESAALVLGRTTGVLAAQTDRPINLITLEQDSETPVEVPTELHPHMGPVPPKESSKPNVAKDEDRSKPHVAKEDLDVVEAPLAEDTKPDTKPDQRDDAPSREKGDAKRPPWPTRDDVAAVRASPSSKPAQIGRAAVGSVEGARAMPALQSRAHAGDPVSSWRDRVHGDRARTAEPSPTLWEDALPAWREEAVAWARANIAAGGDPSANTATFARIGEPPTSTPFGAMIARYELSPQLQPVIALLYGAHLAGHDGVAPADIARLLGGRWEEALGRGELAQHGVVEPRSSAAAGYASSEWRASHDAANHSRASHDASNDSRGAGTSVATSRGSRVRLAAPVLSALDELTPSTGQLIGTPGAVTLLGPCVIVSAGPLGIIAEACLSSIGGAILAGHSGVDPLALIAEARAYGAAPMWRVDQRSLVHLPTNQPIILVVDDDGIADALGIPRLQ